MSPTSNTEDPKSFGGNKDAKAINESLADCLLSQYRLCAAGVGLGTAYSLKYKKGIAPMIATGTFGAMADMVYAYLVECADFTASRDDNSTQASTPTKSHDNSEA